MNKFVEADGIVVRAGLKAKRMAAENEEIRRDAEARRRRSESLPRYFREYYLRCHAFQLRPVLFVLFFFFYKAYNVLNLVWLKVRRAVGVPKDYIDLRKLMFVKNHLQTAIDVLNPGGEVYVPAGSNSISTEITAVSNMKLRGSGRASIIQAAAASNQDSLVYVNEKNHVTIQDLYFDNNVANQTSGGNACIKVAGDSSNITIKNIVLEGGCASGRAGYAIYIDGGEGKTVENVIIENVFDDGWSEQAPVVVLRSNRVSISKCIFMNEERCAIDIKDLTADVTIANNIFYHIGDMTMAQGHGVSLNTVTSVTPGDFPQRVTITGNVCYLCFGDAILAEKCFYVAITGNVVYGNLSGASTADDGDMGISTAGAEVTITGNVVALVGNCGIAVDGTHTEPQYRRVVTGNFVRDCGRNSTVTNAAGIWINDAQFTLVANNFCMDTLGSQEYGIRSAGQSAYNMYIGNYLHGNDTANLSFESNRDTNLIFANYCGETSNQELTEFTRFKVYHIAAAENWMYFSNNCGGQNPQNVVGLQVGYNKSNGNGEANVVWNSSTGASSNLIFAEFDGTNYNNRMSLIKGGGLIVNEDVELDGALNHDGTTVGFYGTAPIAQAVLATGVGATVDDVITALQNLGLVKQS